MGMLMLTVRTSQVRELTQRNICLDFDWFSANLPFFDFQRNACTVATSITYSINASPINLHPPTQIIAIKLFDEAFSEQSQQMTWKRRSVEDMSTRRRSLGMAQPERCIIDWVTCDRQTEYEWYRIIRKQHEL